MSMFETLQRLLDAEVDFVLVGGLAVALHGYQRVTLDIDLVLAMTPDNLQRFIDIAKADGLKPVIPVPVGPLTIPIASIDHLIAMKTGTGRSKDEIDIDELRKIQASRS